MRTMGEYDYTEELEDRYLHIYEAVKTNLTVSGMVRFRDSIESRADTEETVRVIDEEIEEEEARMEREMEAQ